MTQPENLIADLIGPAPETGGFFEDFDIFESNAWKPFEKWDSEALTRESFAEQLYDLGKMGAHELRAAALQRFSNSIAGRLGASSLTVNIGEATSYTFAEKTGILTLDYRTSLVGTTEKQQMNAFIGLLVRGVGEHLLNEPGSRVREFMDAVSTDFGKFSLPELGDYVAQNAKIALTDRAISAQIKETYPGFEQYALSGLYALQAQATQSFVVSATKMLDDGQDAEGKPLTREDRKRLELEMASQYLQASTTAPGAAFIDAGRFPWAMDIEQSGLMYRNITNLDVDHEFASRGNDIYARVVERILDLPDEPPAPEPGSSELPDLGALMDYHMSSEASLDSAKNSRTAKSAMENASDLPTDSKVKWDQQAFEQIMDQEVEPCNERTPWAEGNPKVSYFTVKAKAGLVARARYALIRRAYGSHIRKLRGIIEDQYTTRMTLERGLRSGRPDGTRLVGTRFGRLDVFKRNTPEIQGEPIDIVMLLDESGSMGARVEAKGRVKIAPVLGSADRNTFRELAGLKADMNAACEDGGGTRADVSRAMAVMIHAAVHGLSGIRCFSLGYTTDDPKRFGIKGKMGGSFEGTSIIRTLGDPKNPHAAALTLAYGGNGDKEALHAAAKLLEQVNQGGRKAIIYLADGGISDPVLESMLKNMQRDIPIFFVDMSNSVRGTGGSLKIDHSVTVNSIPEAVRGVARFFTDVVLA